MTKDANDLLKNTPPDPPPPPDPHPVDEPDPDPDQGDEVTERAEILKDIQAHLATLSPDTISRYAIRLSVYLATDSEDLADAETAYYEKWEAIRLNVDTDGKADKRTKATVEYHTKRVAELRREGTKEIINALKKRLGVLSDENENRY